MKHFLIRSTSLQIHGPLHLDFRGQPFGFTCYMPMFLFAIRSPSQNMHLYCYNDKNVRERELATRALHVHSMSTVAEYLQRFSPTLVPDRNQYPRLTYDTLHGTCACPILCHTWISL